MLSIYFKPTFIRQLNKLPKDLREEAIERIELLKCPENHSFLKVHKLRGRLSGRHSFSVNYKTRIVFACLSQNEVVLLAIGDHSVYDE